MFEIHGDPAIVIPSFLAIFVFIGLVAFCTKMLQKPKRIERTPLELRPQQDDLGWELGAEIMKSRCPDCGEPDWYYGPVGGITTKIYCTRRTCRHGFEVMNFGNGQCWARRVEDGADSLYY